MAEWEKISDIPYEATIQVKALRSWGSTNFVGVFDLLGSYIESGSTDKAEQKVGSFMKKLRSSSKDHAADVDKEAIKKKKIIFFMTDGCDTCNGKHSIMASKEKLQDKIAAYGEEVIVNVLGFSSHHDDAFLESLSLIGTSDGSYNYIPVDQGDSALKKKLVELLEETTGLVGKSIFLELKMENEARFLGDWFGQGEKAVVLQAFMQINDGTAKIKTAKFVKIPEEGLKMTINMMRDLKDDTVVIPCTLTNTKGRVAFTDKMRLLKLRASLNLLTAKLGNSFSDDSGTEKATKLVLEWLKAVKAFSDQVDTVAVSKSNDAELKKLSDAVKNGLTLCERTLTKDPSQDHNSYMKNMRGIHASWNIQSKQAQNHLQVKCKSKGGHVESKDRSRYRQQMHAYSDV